MPVGLGRRHKQVKGTGVGRGPLLFSGPDRTCLWATWSSVPSLNGHRDSWFGFAIQLMTIKKSQTFVFFCFKKNLCLLIGTFKIKRMVIVQRIKDKLQGAQRANPFHSATFCVTSVVT